MKLLAGLDVHRQTPPFGRFRDELGLGAGENPSDLTFVPPPLTVRRPFRHRNGFPCLVSGYAGLGAFAQVKPTPVAIWLLAQRANSTSAGPGGLL